MKPVVDAFAQCVKLTIFTSEKELSPFHGCANSFRVISQSLQQAEVTVKELSSLRAVLPCMSVRLSLALLTC